MKTFRTLLTVGLLSAACPAALFPQNSTIYVSVLSTKLFVVGAANPQTGLYYKGTSPDTLWQHIGPANIRAFGLAVYTPSKGSLLYIASGNGVHKSSDGGKSWKITTGWQITEALCAAIGQSDPNFILCATPYGVYRTEDGGSTWKECTKGINQKFTSSVIIDHANPNLIYCSTEDGVYQSKNRGDSWERLGLNVGGVRIVAQHPRDPAILIVGTDDNGIYITRNGGKYWEKSEAGLDHQTFYAVAFDPTNPDVVYAGGYITGVYKSTDGGKSWVRKNDGLTNLNVHAIAVDPTNGNRVIVGTQFGGVFQSDDAGTTWHNIGLSGSQVWTVSVQPF
jgi:photosystem II stability/assembly factor-like uncharacterized protein